MTTDSAQNKDTGLINQVMPDTGEHSLDAITEESWIDVIHKMDSVYANLVDYQVELEEKNTELEEAHHFINSVLSSMTDVLIVCDTQNRIQRVNHKLEDLIEQSAEVLVGRYMYELFDQESKDNLARYSKKVLSETVYDCEVNLLSSEKGLVPLALNCGARYDHKGRYVGMVLIGRPVGELRQAYKELNTAHQELQQAQQQLLQSEKMASLGRLVAGVAHELNNPISFVFGNIHALKRYGARFTSYLEAIHSHADREEIKHLREDLKIDSMLSDIDSLIDGTLEGAERVKDIVQDLRRFSSSQRDEKQWFNLSTVLRTAVQWVVKAERVKPEVSFQIPDELEVNAHEGQIHQILVNLVQNAVDVMEEVKDPRLEVVCYQKDDKAVVEIRDFGSGIPDEDLVRVFDPFFTTKPVGKGTGLGLYISYNIADEHCGSLQVKNHSEGGAVFILTLPLSIKS